MLQYKESVFLQVSEGSGFLGTDLDSLYNQWTEIDISREQFVPPILTSVLARDKLPSGSTCLH